MRSEEKSFEPKLLIDDANNEQKEAKSAEVCIWSDNSTKEKEVEEKRLVVISGSTFIYNNPNIAVT